MTYKINAVTRDGDLIAPAMADTPRAAYTEYRAALRIYPCVWVSDEAGDVSEKKLIRWKN